MVEITHAVARKVLNTVDAGLSKGVGKRKLGEMCVEAAVCFALGEKHGDEPTCVSPVLRAFKIGLNDAEWSSPHARSVGLRRLALAQLGSNIDFDGVDFAKRQLQQFLFFYQEMPHLGFALRNGLERQHRADGKP